MLRDAVFDMAGAGGIGLARKAEVVAKLVYSLSRGVTH
jgi:hypothetical protein